jgi:hypothetical protein
MQEPPPIGKIELYLGPLIGIIVNGIFVGETFRAPNVPFWYVSVFEVPRGIDKPI